jgi:hypothetical protein
LKQSVQNIQKAHHRDCQVYVGRQVMRWQGLSRVLTWSGSLHEGAACWWGSGGDGWEWCSLRVGLGTSLLFACSQSLGPNTHMQKFSTQFVDRYCSVLCKQQAGHNVFKLFLECLVELHG